MNPTSLLVRTGKRRKAVVQFRDDFDAARAADRRAQMLASLKATKFDANYEKVDPNQANRFSFRSSDVALHYLGWPHLTEFCAVSPSNGLMEKRGSALINMDRSVLERRMRDYYDANVSWDTARRIAALILLQPELDANYLRVKAKTFEWKT